MAKNKRIDWNIPWVKERIGKVSDSIIARKLGCSRERVRKVREAAGIVSNLAARAKPAPEWLPQAVGLATDREIAELADMETHQVRRVRVFLNVPAHLKARGAAG